MSPRPRRALPCALPRDRLHPLLDALRLQEPFQLRLRVPVEVDALVLVSAVVEDHEVGVVVVDPFHLDVLIILPLGVRAGPVGVGGLDFQEDYNLKWKRESFKPPFFVMGV